MPSDGYDTGGGVFPAEIFFPANWTSANLALYTSFDGKTYNQKRDMDGNPIIITAGINYNAGCDPIYMWNSRYIKFVSVNSAGALVPQTNNVTVNMLLRPA